MEELKSALEELKRQPGRYVQIECHLSVWAARLRPVMDVWLRLANSIGFYHIGSQIGPQKEGKYSVKFCKFTTSTKWPAWRVCLILLCLSYFLATLTIHNVLQIYLIFLLREWRPSVLRGANATGNCALLDDIVAPSPTLSRKIETVIEWHESMDLPVMPFNDSLLVQTIWLGFGVLVLLLIWARFLNETLAMDMLQFMHNPKLEIHQMRLRVKQISRQISRDAMIRCKGSWNGLTPCICHLEATKINYQFRKLIGKLNLRAIWPKNMQEHSFWFFYMVFFTCLVIQTLFHQILKRLYSLIMTRESIIFHERQTELATCQQWNSNASLIRDPIMTFRLHPDIRVLMGTWNSSHPISERASPLQRADGSSSYKLIDSWTVAFALNTFYTGVLLLLYHLAFLHELIWLNQIKGHLATSCKMCNIIGHVKFSRYERSMALELLKEALGLNLIELRLFLRNHQSREAYRKLPFYLTPYWMGLIIVVSSLFEHYGSSPQAMAMVNEYFNISLLLTYIYLAYYLILINRYRLIYTRIHILVGHCAALDQHQSALSLGLQRLALSDTEVQHLHGSRIWALLVTPKLAQSINSTLLGVYIYTIKASQGD